MISKIVSVSINENYMAGYHMYDNLQFIGTFDLTDAVNA